MVQKGGEYLLNKTIVLFSKYSPPFLYAPLIGNSLGGEAAHVPRVV